MERNVFTEDLKRYHCTYGAGRFLERWCRRVTRRRIELMKSVGAMSRSHREPILRWLCIIT